jgi:hypothetical protein
LFFIFEVLLSSVHAASKVTTDVFSVRNWLGYIDGFHGIWSLRPKEGAEEMEPDLGQYEQQARKQQQKKGGWSENSHLFSQLCFTSCDKNNTVAIVMAGFCSPLLLATTGLHFLTLPHGSE